jgi:hypothetical protein
VGVNNKNAHDVSRTIKQNTSITVELNLRTVEMMKIFFFQYQAIKFTETGMKALFFKNLLLIVCIQSIILFLN